MKIVDSVSSINGRSVLVYGGRKHHRDEFINAIFLGDEGSKVTKVVLDSYEKHVTVEQIRNFIQSSHYSSLHVSQITVYILYGAEKLSGVVQNTLLKTLEEVPPGKAFILEAPALESVMPTIQSRVFPISVSSDNIQLLNVQEWRTMSLPALFKLAEDYSDDHERAKEVLHSLLDFVRKEQFMKGMTHQTINYSEFLLSNYSLIGSTNASVRLILENSLLSFYALFKTV